MLPLAPGGASAAEPGPDRLRAIREQRAQTDEELDALRLSETALEESLDETEARIAEARRQLQRAEEAASAADDHARSARVELGRISREVERLRRVVRDVAVQSFLEGPPPGATEALLLGNDVAEAGRARELVDAVAAKDIAAIDHLEAAEDELDLDRQRLDEAVIEARRRRDEAERRLGVLREEQARQASQASSVEDRIAERLSEAASLARIDAGLAAEIEAEQQALARRLPQPSKEPYTASPDEQLPTAAPPVRRAPTTGAFVDVGGIVVSAGLAEGLAGLLRAASSAGIPLGGRGYRDPADQVRLRRQNCGTSSYAVYVVPASSCSPPTARPGSSLHERGLAIDFTYAGSAITSRSHPGFRWLAANAGRFGLRNLPSEPWHWSTSGQ